MRLPEPTTPWLPSTEQIMLASERAILAALDVNLELAIRSLKAEHAELGPDGRLAMDPDDEPYTFNLLPVAQALVLCAKHLRKLVAKYRIVADDLLKNAHGEGEPLDDDPIQHGDGDREPLHDDPLQHAHRGEQTPHGGVHQVSDDDMLF
jgi:hypothetical protein